MKTKNQSTVKQLNTRLNTLIGEFDALKLEMSARQKELSQKNSAIDKLKNQIKQFENRKEPDVSEHAILRYLERVKGIDLEEIKKEILNDGVKDLIGKLGPNGKYPNGDFGVLLKNNVVVTIVK